MLIANRALHWAIGNLLKEATSSAGRRGVRDIAPEEYLGRGMAGLRPSILERAAGRARANANQNFRVTVRHEAVTV